MEKEREYLDALKEERRLVIVLDIDNTLLHSVDAGDLSRLTKRQVELLNT